MRYGLRIEEKDVVTSFKATRSQGFGPEVKRRIMLGTYALSAGYYDAYYLKALKVRNLIKQDYDRVFEKFDCLITPTAPSTALTRGQNMDPLSLYKQDICTIPSNLAGIPALSIPYGTVGDMPVGVQLLGKAFGESTLLTAAYALEQQDVYKRQQQIDTEGVEPLAHVLPIKNVLRSDEVGETLPKEKVLANAPNEIDGMFGVPKIV